MTLIKYDTWRSSFMTLLKPPLGLFSFPRHIQYFPPCLNLIFETFLPNITLFIPDLLLPLISFLVFNQFVYCCTKSLILNYNTVHYFHFNDNPTLAHMYTKYTQHTQTLHWKKSRDIFLKLSIICQNGNIFHWFLPVHTDSIYSHITSKITYRMKASLANNSSTVATTSQPQIHKNT